MVTGKKQVEKGTIQPGVSYRALPALNVSPIKIFEKQGMGAFYKQFVLKELSKGKEKDEEKSNIIIGNILDYILTDCDGSIEYFEQNYDERFHLFNGIKSNSQEFLLADELFRLMKVYINEEGEVTEEFIEIFTEAFRNMQADEKFKGKTVDKALELFNAVPSEGKISKNPYLTSAREYFEKKMEHLHKQMVDMWQLDCGKRLHQQAMTDEFVYDVFHTPLEVQNKLVIEWIQKTKNGDMSCKAELDKTLWDNDTRTVYPKDIKTIYDNRKEQVKRQYYSLLYGWQAEFYKMGLKNYLDRNDMKDWKIAPFEFIFFSTGNQNRPNRLEMSLVMENDASYGYHDGYKWNKGLLTVLDEIAWAETTGVYNVEYETFNNNGKISW